MKKCLTFTSIKEEVMAKLSSIRTKYEIRLKGLSKELTNHHITVIAVNVGCSHQTVRNYLAGQVSDIETAEAIIDAAEFELEN